MILCITTNPAVDVIYNLEDLDADGINRVDEVYKTPGGKGINVSKVLDLLKADFLVTGFIGGRNGEYVIDRLDEYEIEHDFVFTNVDTRNCIRVIYSDKQLEIFEKSNRIDERFEKAFMSLMKDIKNKYSTVTISGSLINGLSDNFLENLIELLQERSKVILDTNGNIVRRVLMNGYKPCLIKPNYDEFKEIIDFDKNLSAEEFVNKDGDYLRKILENEILEGIEILLITCGRYGAVLKYDNKIYRIKVPKYEELRSVGSGDATVAGLSHFLDNGCEVLESVKRSLALGVINAKVLEVEKIDVNKINETKKLIKIEEI